MKHQVNLSVRLSITDDDIDAIMNAALPEGFNYWCDHMTAVEGRYFGKNASDHITKGGSLLLHDWRDADYVLTLDQLLTGIGQAYCDGYGDDWHVNYGVGADLIESYIDLGRIDADTANAIIQYAIFGELVY